MIALVGPTASGKSTYLTVLINELMKETGQKLAITVEYVDDMTQDRYETQFREALFGRNQILAQTPSLSTDPKLHDRPLVFRIAQTRKSRGRARGGKRPDRATLVFFDSSGQDATMGADMKRYLRYLKYAAGIIYMFDPTALKEAADDVRAQPLGPVSRPRSAYRVIQDATMTLRPSDETLIKVPTAVVVAKADTLKDAVADAGPLEHIRSVSGLRPDERDSINEFVRTLFHRWEMDLDTYMQQNYENYALFAVSSLGRPPLGQEVAPEGIHPKRVADPLLWMLSELGLLRDLARLEMAHQLHYTSSTEGLSGYSGFQFIAVSRGLPTGLEHVVSRYLSYRLPPSVPSLSSAEEIDHLPVAFCYVASTYGPVLTHCRYLGVDYSGRPGNFFGHAVVATPEELSGLRPIEFWKAPWWVDRPGSERPPRILPQLTLVRPDSVVEPRRVLKELTMRAEALQLLAFVVDATLRVMDSAQGQVILIAEDSERVVTWIAAIAYSLPYSLVADLSFITFTAEPAEVPYRLVGTSTSVWRERGGRGLVFDLDDLSAPEEFRELSRFGTAVADAWRTGDLLRIDSISELADLLLADGGAGNGKTTYKCETAATLAQMCAGEVLSSVDAAFVVDVLQRSPDQLPEQVWRALSYGTDQDYELTLAAWRAAGRLGRPAEADQIGVRCVRRALENPGNRKRLRDPGPLTQTAKSTAAQSVHAVLCVAPTLQDVAETAWVSSMSRVPIKQSAIEAAAVAATAGDHGGMEAALVAVPDEYADCFISGAVTGLESAPEPVRAANLTSEVCRRLAHWHWERWPRVGISVLSDLARHESDRRVELTSRILKLNDELGAAGKDVNDVLTDLWFEMPSAQERRLLLNQVPSLPAEKARYQLMAFVTRPWNGVTIRQPAEYQIACRICQLDNGQNATVVAVDAWLVRALHEIRKGTERQRYGRVFEVEDYLPRGSSVVAAEVADGVARAVAEFRPSFQVGFMSRRLSGPNPSPLQQELRALWFSERSADPGLLSDLAEVAISLQRKGSADPALETHVAERVRASGLGQQVFTELDRRDRSLGQGFQQLMGEPAVHPQPTKRGWAKLTGGLVKKYIGEPDDDAPGGDWTRE